MQRGQKTRFCYRKTRPVGGKEHEYVTEKHGPRGLKSPAVEPAKHGGAGRLSVEAPVRPMRVEIPSRKAGEKRSGRATPRGVSPVRPMRVAARVEIPSRKAGETRFIGAPKRGGAPQRPSGLKSPAVKPAKHDRAGRLSVEAPVRPMRVAARVEIPSRKAGETRLSGASKRGGAPLKADVRCSRRCLFFAYGRPRCAAISG